jgi:uridylate kinase
MDRVSLVFGGSILAPPEPDPAFLAEAARRLAAWSRERPLFVVVGGGSPARTHIAAARACGVAEEMLDRIGIQATRLNAQTLACILRREGADVNLEIPHSAAQAIRFAQQHAIVVMGGTVPGHSTDYVAAELAVEGRCARLVNATNVAGVFDKDPKRHADARLLERLSFQDLLDTIPERAWTSAGAPGVLDGPATVLVARSGVETCVVDGRDLANLGQAVAGRPFKGTRVTGPAVRP